tara:strand:+ start:146 stop:616 length:471 start_codon:yes stop_codon:yes gene_type:complete
MLRANWVLKFHDTMPFQAQAKQRPRTVRRKSGKIDTYTPDKTRHFEDAVARWIAGAFSLRAKPLSQGSEPVKLEVLCVFPRPQKLCRKKDPDGYLWRTAKPDASNLLKSIEDGIEKAKYIVENDAQFVDVHIQKVYGDKDQAPEIKVWIYTLGGDQ